MTWRHPRADAPLAAASAEYARRTGIRVEWQARSLFDFGVQPLEELTSRFDLIVLDHPHVGEAATRGYLAPLDEILPPQQLGALAGRSVGLSHASYAYLGHQWAVAIDAAAQVSAARAEALVDFPKRWLDVVELAASGRVLWPLCPTDAYASFLTLAANLGTPCASAEHGFIEPEAGLAVLQAMDAVATHVPREALELNPIAVLEELSGRRSQFEYVPLIFGYSNYARDGFRATLVTFGDIPAAGRDGPRGSLLGGAGLAVSAASRYPDAAAGFAGVVAGSEIQLGAYLLAGGQPAHLDVWESSTANTLTHGFFARTRATLDGAWLRPRHDGFLAVQERGMHLVHAYLRRALDGPSMIRELNAAYRESIARLQEATP